MYLLIAWVWFLFALIRALYFGFGSVSFFFAVNSFVARKLPNTWPALSSHN